MFNSDEYHSNPIALAWMIKLYMAENLPKITISKFNDINNQDEFNCLIDNKINQLTDFEMRKTINNCFAILTKELNLAEQLKSNKEDNTEIKLTWDSVIGSMLTAFIEKKEDPIVEFNFLRDNRSKLFK
ncbi:MAG TPA: hypothetical protein ACHBX0_07865 [Arsenophonus sp.]